MAKWPQSLGLCALAVLKTDSREQRREHWRETVLEERKRVADEQKPTKSGEKRREEKRQANGGGKERATNEKKCFVVPLRFVFGTHAPPTHKARNRESEIGRKSVAKRSARRRKERVRETNEFSIRCVLLVQKVTAVKSRQNMGCSRENPMNFARKKVDIYVYSAKRGGGRERKKGEKRERGKCVRGFGEKEREREEIGEDLARNSDEREKEEMAED
ncbi:hypothetical protein niasHT_021955 [Heterodera trifolii]|uniref:Uncharacterized protein n=1 Tax=Heterodera trifolii TaxID=157864 RepID=A0ABD2K012_9BILA